MSISALIALGLLTSAKESPVRPVPFTDVHFNDAFWAPKIEVNRTVTIPYAFGKCEETGRVNLFERAARALRGEPLADRSAPGYPFDESDEYKILEGAAYCLAVKKDPKLDKYVDEIIAKIAAAQEPDGYLYTTRTINPEHPHEWSGKERWVNEQDNSHELYNLGHLYEAAVAHYQATGKKTLLNVAIKSADLLDRTFGPGKRKIWPGHEVVEMGLAKLSRATGNKRYLMLAKFFLDCRGGAGEYWQAHKPVVEQTEAVGHAVRASYLYTGMADVATMTGDVSYVKAIDTLWDNVVSKKLYITGGIGATGAGEAFGANYELPNMSAYCETCAAIGNAYWNQRLFFLHAEGKYFDVLERTLYNGLISGVGLDGKSFFYPNPLESNGQHSRSAWFGCACCPGNVARFMASVPGYVYAEQGKNLFVNLYVGSDAKVSVDGSTVDLKQTTNYPWDGKIKLDVNPAKSKAFALKVRIPGWALNQAVPSDLYRFTTSIREVPTLSVNGKNVDLAIDRGYATIDRVWKKGDVVTLSLPMPVRRIEANDKVEADKGRIALQSGPIVYALEWKDNPGVKVRNLMVADDAPISTELKPELLGGVKVLKGTAQTVQANEDGKPTVTKHEFTAIPYYAWANRGRGEMTVWIPNSVDSVRKVSAVGLAQTAKVTTSGGTGREAINDGELPRSVFEEATFFHWWPKKGTTEWVEYTFTKASTVSSAGVYWMDDTGRGECRVPKSWRVLYKDGDEWKPVSDTSGGVEKDKLNSINFTPVTTTALKLEVTLQEGWSTGIYEWTVK